MHDLPHSNILRLVQPYTAGSAVRNSRFVERVLLVFPKDYSITGYNVISCAVGLR